MIYTLTLNPSVDLIVSLERFVEGRVNLTEAEYKLPGGKGINVSQVLKNLGHESRALGFVGGFTGRFITDELDKRGVETDFVEVEGDTRINIKMKDNKFESELNGNSPAISEERLDELLKKLRELKKDDLLIMSGSVPKTLPIDIYRKILDGIDEDIRVVIDTKGAALEEAVKAGPYLIKPNNHELEDIFGVKIETQEEIVKYGRKLLEMGAENVVVSMAGDGALLINCEGTYFGNVPAGKVVNSVGAGDSLVGGFSSGLAEGMNLIECFRRGIASGSASAFSENLCSKREVEELIEQVKVEKIQER